MANSQTVIGNRAEASSFATKNRLVLCISLNNLPLRRWVAPLIGASNKAPCLLVLGLGPDVDCNTVQYLHNEQRLTYDELTGMW